MRVLVRITGSAEELARWQALPLSRRFDVLADLFRSRGAVAASKRIGWDDDRR